MKTEKINFEKAMKRLNEISALMNSEDLPLDKAIGLYSEASDLITVCKDEMSNAQLELKTLFMGGE